MKRKMIILLALSMILVFAGCKDKEQKKKVDTTITVDENGMLIIYEATDCDVVRREAEYQLKHPESLSKSIEEILVEESETNVLSVTSYSLEENNNLTLIAEIKEDSSSERLFLSKAAVVWTIQELKDVGTIHIIINDASGKVIDDDIYGRESFFYYSE